MSDSRLISAASHFVEPRKMWKERLDRRSRHRAPHAVKLAGNQGEYFVCEGPAPAPPAAFFRVPAAEMPRFLERGFDDAPKAVRESAPRLYKLN